MEPDVNKLVQTLDERLSAAFKIFRMYSKEDMEGLFGIDPGWERLESLKSGYAAAEKGEKINLWGVRNRGYALAEKLLWSILNTENWIRDHQEIYEKGFDFFMNGQGELREIIDYSAVGYVKTAA